MYASLQLLYGIRTFISHHPTLEMTTRERNVCIVKQPSSDKKQEGLYNAALIKP
jgi:hypothetical protein